MIWMKKVRFPVILEQKLGTRDHWALLEHSPAFSKKFHCFELNPMAYYSIRSNFGQTNTQGLRMCCLCCDIYKGLDILVFSDKDKNCKCHLTALSQLWFLWGLKKPTLMLVNSRGVGADGLVQPFMGLVGNEGVDFEGSKSCVIPVTLLSHHGNNWSVDEIIQWYHLNKTSLVEHLHSTILS